MHHSVTPVLTSLSGDRKTQAPLHGYRLRICCTTPPTDELTTILQLVVQQIRHQRTKICHIAMPEPNISTCLDFGTNGALMNCSGSCPAVIHLRIIQLSVGGSVCVRAEKQMQFLWTLRIITRRLYTYSNVQYTMTTIKRHYRTARSEIRPAKDPEDFRQCFSLELHVNTGPIGHTTAPSPSRGCSLRPSYVGLYCHNAITHSTDQTS